MTGRASDPPNPDPWPGPDEPKKGPPPGPRALAFFLLLVALPLLALACDTFSQQDPRHGPGPGSGWTPVMALGCAVLWGLVSMMLANALGGSYERGGRVLRAALWVTAGVVSAVAAVLILSLRWVLFPVSVRQLIQDPAHLSTVSCRPRDPEGGSLYRGVPIVTESRKEAFEELVKRVH